MSNIYTQLEQQFKAKNWQDCINLSLACDLMSLDDGQYKNYLWWTGQAYKQLSQYTDAENQFHLLKEKFPDSHLGLEGFINIAQQQKDWGKVIHYALEFNSAFPNLWHSYWWLGRAYLSTKEYELAENWFELLSSKFPKQYHGIFGLTETAYENKDWELTISRGLELQTKKADAWQGYWWVGHAYKNLSQYDKAQEQFHLLNQKLPNLYRGLQGLVSITQHLKDWEATISLAKQYQEKFPNLWHSYWWLGQAYKNLADYDNATQQFSLAQNKLPNDFHGYQGMIDIANHQNNWQDLLKFSEKYIQAFPEKIEGYYHKGMALKNLKQSDEAETFFIELASRFPDKTQPLTGLANLYYTLRKFEKGIETLEKAVALSPDDQNIVHQLINYCIRYSNPDKALMYFESHISDPMSTKNQLLLARIHQIKYSNAYYIDELEKLYQTHPNDIEVALAYANALISFTMEEK